MDLPRKRGRKKKCVIESIKKLRDNDEEQKEIIEFDSINDSVEEDARDKTQVSFGALNIIVYKPETQKVELKKMFDIVESNKNNTDHEKTINDEEVNNNDNNVPNDILCNWCCHKCVEQLGLPVDYDEASNTFTLEGYFCSWPCVIAYAHAHNKTSMYWISYMHKKMGIRETFMPAGQDHY